MATLFSSSLVPESSVAASIRGWATWIEQVITTLGGWTVTSDTGQTAPGSLPGATAQDQKCGYRIYQINDDFAVDFPIFMRVDYGSGGPYSNAPAGWQPGVWFSFGGGTDGAGNLTGLYWNGVGWQAGPTIKGNNHPSQSLATYTTRNYASGDMSRFIFGMFVNDFSVSGFGTDQIVFSFERSRDKEGNYTGDGVMLTYSDIQLYGGGGTTAQLNATKYIICANPGMVQPPLEGGLAYVYVRHSPAYSYDGTVPCGIASHFRGVAQQPGINFCLVGTNDISGETQFLTKLYGANHTYQHLKYMVSGRAYAGQVGTSARPGGIADAGCKVAILWE